MNNEKTINDRDNGHEIESLFVEIFKKHEPRLYKLSLRLTKSDLYAKDIIQEVFLKLWENRATLHSIQNIEAWLYRATENKIIDLLRKMASDNRLKDVVWNKIQKQTDETELSLITREYHQAIRQAIDQLPPQRKLIYCLNKEAGMNYNQIADELSISRHTVKNQLSTALRSVRKFFSKNMQLFTFFS